MSEYGRAGSEYNRARNEYGRVWSKNSRAYIYDVNNNPVLAWPCQAYYQFFWQSLDIFCVFSSSSSDLNCSKKTTRTSRFSHFWKLNAVNITEGRMGGTKNQVCRLKKSYSFDCIPLVPPLSWSLLAYPPVSPAEYPRYKSSQAAQTASAALRSQTRRFIVFWQSQVSYQTWEG